MRKIQLYRAIGMPFDGKKYREGIGGLETQAVELAEAFIQYVKDCSVEVYNNSQESLIYGGVKYLPAVEFKGDGDLVIGVDMIPDASFPKKGKWVSWVHTPGLNCASDELDYVVCNSQWTREYYEGERPADNYITIPNGMRYYQYFNDCWDKVPYSIMLAGSVAKGFKRIPEIFKKVKKLMPEATFSVYGGARVWGQKEADYEYIYKPIIEAGIDYRGLVSKGDLGNEYARTEVYFQPRCDHTETFGLCVAEAMAAGCVPVCSKKGNLEYLINDGCGVLLDYDESIDEAEVLVELLRDNDKLKRLSKEANREAEQYDWKEIIKLWEKLL